MKNKQYHLSEQLKKIPPVRTVEKNTTRQNSWKIVEAVVKSIHTPNKLYANYVIVPQVGPYLWKQSILLIHDHSLSWFGTQMIGLN